jgi:hypothetical protein
MNFLHHCCVVYSAISLHKFTAENGDVNAETTFIMYLVMQQGQL